MKILITGCAGYIGSALTLHMLQAGHKIVGIDSLTYNNGHVLLPCLGAFGPRFEFHKVDVREIERVSELAKGADVVIPLAAIVGAPACELQPETADAVNCWAVCELVSKLSKYQRVIYPNTNSGYGQRPDGTPVTEEDGLKPISTYGLTKCGAEKCVLEHPNSAVFRLATVFGVSPRMRLDLLVNDFTAKLLTEGNLRIFEPNYMRNYVGINDVVRAFEFAMDNPHLKGVYNLGLPDANLSKLELANLVADTVGLSRGVIRVVEGRDPDQRNYVVSNQKILDAGFYFEHSLSRGIKDVAEAVGVMTKGQIASARNFGGVQPG